MVSKRPVKNWQRPLDWRWVNYSDQLSDDFVIAMRALTAQCSEESTSPKNAKELAALIKTLFIFEEANRQELKLNQMKIQKAISRGRSAQAIKLAEDIKVINSSYMAAYRVYRDLYNALESIYAELAEASIPVKKIREESLDSIHKSLLTHSGRNSATLYELEFGEQEAQQFYFRVNCYVYIPSLEPYTNAPAIRESSNIFTFVLQRYGNLNRLNFPHRENWVTLERTGELTLRTDKMRAVEKTDIRSLSQMIRSWILEDDAWEIIQRDR